MTDAAASDWSDSWSITLRSAADTSPIVQYALRTSTGETLQLSPSMSMSGMGTWHQTLNCEHEIGSGTLILAYWKNAERIEVPFEMTTGIGLDGRATH